MSVSTQRIFHTHGSDDVIVCCAVFYDEFMLYTTSAQPGLQFNEIYSLIKGLHKSSIKLIIVYPATVFLCSVLVNLHEYGWSF